MLHDGQTVTALWEKKFYKAKIQMAGSNINIVWDSGEISLNFRGPIYHAQCLQHEKSPENCACNDDRP